MNRLLIIGASDAGISAALCARELSPETQVTVVARDHYPNFSICGLPFFLSGEVSDWHTLAHRTAADLEATGMKLLLDHTAASVDADGHTVTLRDRNGETVAREYDKLIIGTGALPATVGIQGVDQPGVFLLRWMADAFAVDAYVREHGPRDAVIIGGGYIGLEMADSLRKRGLNVRVLEYAPQVLTTVDAELAQIVADELERHGVLESTGVGIQRIETRNGRPFLVGPDFQTDADLVVVAVGVRPNTALAESAGVTTGVRGALQVNRRMETNVRDVYAAGDCVETYHRLLDQQVYMPLGTTAHKQGRVAGENAVGGDAVYGGSLGTQVVKVFDLVAARTGLRQHEAAAAGLDPLTVQVDTWDHKVYYPDATRLHVRLTGDRVTGKLLGGQLLGHRRAEVSKRVDVLAVALHHGMTVDGLNELDLTYTPPLSSPWDPVQMAAQAWVKAHT